MRSQPGLVVARSSSLVNLPPPPSASYTRDAVASPVAMSIAVCAGCIGLGFAGLLGALIATLAVVVLAAHTARYRVVRRYLDHQARLHERTQRDQLRLRLLRPSGAVRIAH